jgi:TonB-linked SusC/RagA family outer membrane protein
MKFNLNKLIRKQMNMNRLLTLKKRLSHYALMLFFTILCSVMNAQAQNKTVKGTVVGSSDGMPIPGVSIIIKGTKTGTTTDFDGKYNIQSKIGDVLEFIYLGMQTETKTVTKFVLNVSMDESIEDLEEVVVIGYGTVTKKELTGAVAQVKAEEIERFVTADVSSALQGQIAGVSVVSGSGQPGEQGSIQIRGITSLSGTNDPLYVVDGIPQVGNPGLSSNEIETIDVLKDAASTAVYGARGAAGVILITTKKGEDGRMKVTFNHTYGVQYLGKGTPLMNTEDQIYYEVTKFNNIVGGFDPGPHRNPEWLNNDNDFNDYVINSSADTKNYILNITGGTKGFSYNAVGGFFNQTGQLINSGFKRYNGRISTSYNSDNWKINASIAFTTENTIRTTNGLLVSAIRYAPYYPFVDIDSDIALTDGNGGVNTPLNTFAQQLKQRNNTSRDRINTSLSISRKFGENFNFVTRIGSSVRNDINNTFKPKYTLFNIIDGTTETDPTKNGVSAEAIRASKFSWDASLNYNKKIGNHSISLLGSISLEEEYRESFEASKQGVANNSIDVLNGSTINPQAFSSTGGINYSKKTVGTLGRIQYNYKRRYLISALARYDGSSRFGKSYRWGTFPSLSLAWNVSDEPFFKPLKSTVNNFKLRASQGTVGNDSFGDYEFSSTISQLTDYVFDATDNAETLGAAIKSYANADVKWETSVSKNIGFDLGLFKNKVTLTGDYYTTEKRDMLFPVQLPGSAGAYYDRNLTLNVGNMTNKGLELAARYRPRIGESRLDFSTTFTKNQNKITKMAGDSKLIYNSNSALINGDGASVITVLAEGYEAGAFFIYETNGTIINQEQLDEYRKLPSRQNAELGDLIYVDQITEDTNGDGIADATDGDINNDDRVYSGSGLPEYELGFNFRWNYRNWDLSMNWYATVGSEIMNGNKAATYSFGRHQDLVNMWSTENPTSNIPLHRGDSKSHDNFRGYTDLWLENGDYLRLKLITLGYTLSKDVTEKVGLYNLRLYVSAQNPLTLTSYDGYDPEVGGNVSRRGIDRSRYPITSLYSLGIKLEF